MIAQLIADAPAASVTFRGLVAAIDATNGIVYVESGQCGHGAQACLVHSIQSPDRIASSTSSSTRAETAELIGAIGHELHHAMEVLSEPGITTTQGMFYRLFGGSMSATGRFESKEAVEAGFQIEHELEDDNEGRHPGITIRADPVIDPAVTAIAHERLGLPPSSRIRRSKEGNSSRLRSTKDYLASGRSLTLTDDFVPVDQLLASVFIERAD